MATLERTAYPRFPEVLAPLLEVIGTLHADGRALDFPNEAELAALRSWYGPGRAGRRGTLSR